MPIQMEYLESERIIHYTATDPWTIDQMDQYTKRAREIYDNASAPVYTVVDVSQAKSLPQGAMRGRANPEFTHPKAGALVIVGASVLVRTITGVVAKLANMNRVHFFENRDEAWTFVRAKIDEDKRETSPSR